MNSKNIVILVGNIGQEPKHGVTKTGTVWCNVSIATQKKLKDNSYGTTWHRVVGFGKIAESMISCRKGDTVFVEGEISNNQYTDKSGAKITTVQVLSNSFLRAAHKESAAIDSQPQYGTEDGPSF